MLSNNRLLQKTQRAQDHIRIHCDMNKLTRQKNKSNFLSEPAIQYTFQKSENCVHSQLIWKLRTWFLHDCSESFSDNFMKAKATSFYYIYYKKYYQPFSQNIPSSAAASLANSCSTNKLTFVYLYTKFYR
jgi:hypothetical protein